MDQLGFGACLADDMGLGKTLQVLAYLEKLRKQDRFVVVIFVYMSMRLQREKQEERHFIETYTISLVKGFAGDSISLFVNDSLITNRIMPEEPYTVEVGRFAEQSALLIVDNNTELVSTFDLSERGGTYQFEKEADGIKQLAK